MKPRRGRPKNAPKPVKMRAVELEEQQRCVDPAPTHKTRAGRIVKGPLSSVIYADSAPSIFKI